jgi:hypothetical protein
VSKTDALDLLGVTFIAAAAGLADPRLALLVFGVAFLLMSRSAIR